VEERPRPREKSFHRREQGNARRRPAVREQKVPPSLRHERRRQKAGERAPSTSSKLFVDLRADDADLARRSSWPQWAKGADARRQSRSWPALGAAGRTWAREGSASPSPRADRAPRSACRSDASLASHFTARYASRRGLRDGDRRSMNGQREPSSASASGSVSRWHSICLITPRRVLEYGYGSASSEVPAQPTVKTSAAFRILAQPPERTSRFRLLPVRRESRAHYSAHRGRPRSREGRRMSNIPHYEGEQP
jgi:hypothetical protein